MYVTENSMGLCIVLESKKDVSHVLSAFMDFGRDRYAAQFPAEVLKALEEELAA